MQGAVVSLDSAEASARDPGRRLGGGRKSVRVVGCVVPRVLLLLVEGPVLVEVAAGPQRSGLKDRLRGGQRPAGPGDLQAIDDQVTAGALDGPSGDGKPRGKVLVVVQVA